MRNHDASGFASIPRTRWTHEISPLGRSGDKKVDPSARSILVEYRRKLQRSEDQITIPAELIGRVEEVPVDTMVRDIYPLDVMAAPRKCECVCVCVCASLKTSVWRNGLVVVLKCASKRKHGVIHHNYKSGRKETLLSGRNLLTVQFGPTVVCYRKQLWAASYGRPRMNVRHCVAYTPRVRI